MDKKKMRIFRMRRRLKRNSKTKRLIGFKETQMILRKWRKQKRKIIGYVELHV